MAAIIRAPVPPPKPPSPKGEMGLYNKLPELRTSDMAVDKSKPLPTSLQSDFLPEDVLFALTQPPSAPDTLGPLSKYRSLNTSVAKSRPPPANVWNTQRRERFKHLTDNTTCTCGAGKDISFLYDVPKPDKKPERPDNIDKSVVRKEVVERQPKILQLPDTLIPEEYHIVKNKGVLGIEHHEDKYSNQVEDHEKHLVIFPSMKPTSRYEVVQLKATMEEMLERAGVNDADVEIKGPTQMHNLLELIKKEQNIYNIVFHELIRQSSIECVERGELLSNLRSKYSNLLNKVPQQIKSLHEEVMAQRALDRRLTEELMRFKSTISVLTSELSEVKEHDKKVTQEAQQAQDDLKKALSDAEKSASLLEEYHDLYELQRRRLEIQVNNLTDEREIWSTAAYCLAMKVTEEAQLTTAKRLHVSEKSWAKLANHFTILLSDKDTDLITKVQTHVESWRDMVEEFSITLKHREEEMRQQLRQLAPGIDWWLKELRKCFTSDGQFVRAPNDKEQKGLLEDMRKWEELLGRETEKFGGDTLLNGQEQLHFIKLQMDGWTDNALQMFGRHRTIDGENHPDQKHMMDLNDDVERLLHQLNTRITGENGVATNVIHLMNGMETWDMKITSSLNGTMPIHDNEWAGLLLTMEEWLAAIEEAIEYVGSTQREEERAEHRPHTRVEVNDTVRRVQKWVTTATNAIDSEDAKLVEQVTTLHSDMIRWMVQVLLRLAPDRPGNSKEAGEMALLASRTLNELYEGAKYIFEQLLLFSSKVVLLSTSRIDNEVQGVQRGTICCNGIVMENTQRRRDQMEENADHELKDLKRLKNECDDWIKTSKLLCSHLMGESVEALFPPPKQDKETKVKDKKQVTLVTDEAYVDQERLVRQEEEEHKTVTDKTEAAGKKEEKEKSAPKAPEAVAKLAGDPKEGEQLEVIGGDDNTHVQSLDKPSGQPPLPGSTLEGIGGPDTGKAYEALAAVEALQKQLLETEQRAQGAEERADNAEAELNIVMEKIREMAKRIAELEKSDNKEVDKEAKPKTPKTPTTPSTRPPSKEGLEVKEEKKRPESQASKSSKSSKTKKK
ncbi:axonemal dynein light chain domain-containing protein 1-like isoform X3 [Dreissena polymorpha]|uniref:axonemal dynein light chain domain-containing protein 1-like isoform X3 n=1 Tax=Dreissena polymorpha TaxID=45954 RepID=UPI00226569FB|nr:axonemal dynein light chain domain-containing protein 1-like isoform X3 [Dreissena polymorpha]